MFKFLGFILIFFLIGFLILGVFLGRVLRLFRSSGRDRTTRRSSSAYNNTTPDPPQKKFSKDEGEYVQYEEIKDDE